MTTRLVLLLLAGLNAAAQTYVTPMLGGGQVAANMAHIDLAYDADANTLLAWVDDSEGRPELRTLPAGEMFDPAAAYAVLNGKAYNAQYGWNPGCTWCFPPGVGIWIELTNASPGLEFYEEFAPFGAGSYAPIFGTAGSPRVWRWVGRMVHNICAIREPVANLYSADFHVYLGDPVTGARFTEFDDTFVHLEWTTVPVEDPMTFKFGAVALTNGAPLAFLNAATFIASSEFVVNLRGTNIGPGELRFDRSVPMLAVAATPANGGPVANHASPGACLELQVQSLTGPGGAQLSFWEPEATEPCFVVRSGTADCTNRIRLSESAGAPGCDPFGRVAGRRFSVSQPGLYCLSFRAVDTSTNGGTGGPLHAPSALYRVYLQAGLTMAALQRQGQVSVATFGGELGKTYYLERTSALGHLTEWETIAGPTPGTNRLQRLTDPVATETRFFYRVRGN